MENRNNTSLRCPLLRCNLHALCRGLGATHTGAIDRDVPEDQGLNYRNSKTPRALKKPTLMWGSMLAIFVGVLKASLAALSFMTIGAPRGCGECGRGDRVSASYLVFFSLPFHSTGGLISLPVA